MAKSLRPIARRGAGRPSAGEAEAHKEAILEVATSVFLENGYAGSSMSRIAESAGASKGTLYALYPSKVELFAALVQRRIGMRITAADREQLMRMDQPVARALEAFAVKLLGWIGSQEGRRWQQLVILEFERFPELSALFWKNGPAVGIENLAQYFKAASLARLLKVANPEQAALQFLGLALGIHYIRNSLGMTPLVSSEDEIQTWVHEAVKSFLHGQATKQGPPKAIKSF